MDIQIALALSVILGIAACVLVIRKMVNYASTHVVSHAGMHTGGVYMIPSVIAGVLVGLGAFGAWNGVDVLTSLSGFLEAIAQAILMFCAAVGIYKLLAITMLRGL